MSKTLQKQPDVPQTINGQSVYRGMMPKREGRTVLKGSLVAVSVGLGLVGALSSFVPVLGNWLAAPVLNTSSHLVDRIKNGVESTDELKFRAKYYSPQIFKTLGIKPREGKVADVDLFKQAAAINPELSKLYNAPIKKKENETRQYKLENYLMLLMDYPDILDSIAFRKFLQLNPLRFNEFKVEYKSYLSSSAAIYDSRLMLEEGSSPIDGTKVAQMDPSKPRSEVTLEPGVNYVSDTFKENETM